MYKAVSPQAEPVRPSWKNLSVADHLRALYVRLKKDQSHQLRVSADIDSQNNLSFNQSHSNIFRISAQKHSDDGHHGQTSVRQLGRKLLFACFWIFDWSKETKAKVALAIVARFISDLHIHKCGLRKLTELRQTYSDDVVQDQWLQHMPHYHIIIEGSVEAKLLTIWTDGNAQPGRSSDMEKARREKIRDAEDQRGRKSEERRCRCAKR